MLGIEKKPVCLCLNSLWQPIEVKTVKEAICDLVCSVNGYAMALAIDVSYPVDENGTPDLSKADGMTTVSWDKWITLPVRNWDMSINTPSIKVRVPTVILYPHYGRMPKRKLKLGKEGVWLRDRKRCQYTGVSLTKDSGTIDHVVSKHTWRKNGLDGSPNCWENLVLCDKELNLRKGDRPFQELGLKLIRKPIDPPPVPACLLIGEANHHDWEHFLIK